MYLRKLLPVFIAVIVIAAVNIFAYGQSSGATAARVTGVVSDEAGAVIGGATIVVRNLNNNLAREAASSEDGSFTIAQLAPGDYEMTVSAEGFAPRAAKMTLSLGTTTRINFALKLGETTEIIEVQAGEALSEGKTESSTNIDESRIDGLPINRRNFLDFTLTSARAVMDRTPAQGVAASSGISFNGQPARFNNITIDGLENNDFGPGAVRSTFSQDAVQEFQIVSDSYSAEFGRALGGVINIVTKGGTNDLHGGIFFLNRNDRTSARDVFAAIEPEFKQYQFGATLSGPIKKDRAFFFGSFERLSIKQNNIVTIADATVAAARRQGFLMSNGPRPVAVGTTTVLARMDARLTPNNTINVRYNGGFTFNGALETFGALVGETSAGFQQLDDNTLAVNNTYINIGLNLVNETRFQYGRRDQNVIQVDDGLQVRITAPEGGVQFGRQGFLPQPREERIYQFVNNVSLLRGRHSTKFGVDVAYVDTPGRRSALPIFPGGVGFFTPLDFGALTGIPGLPVLSGIQTFDPSLRTPAQRAFLNLLSALLPGMVQGFPAGLPLADLGLPFAYAQGFGDASVIVKTKLFSVFAQDDFLVKKNLLIKAGVRYDLSRISSTPDNNGNVSPRLAIAYKPGFLPRVNARASYGLFFGPPIGGPAASVQTTANGALKILTLPFPFSVIPYALPGHRFPESLSLPAGVPFIPQLGTIFNYDQNLRSSYTQQVSAGFDVSVEKDTIVSVTYDFVRGIKLFSVRNINTVVRPVPGDVLASFLTGRVDPSQGDINHYASAFDNYYHALTISLNRRFTRRFGVLAHYTFSKAIDNFVDIRSDQQEIGDPLNLGEERGLSLQDVRNRFVLSGLWELSYTNNPLLRDFQLSTIVTLNSGRPYNLLAGEDLNNDSLSQGDRPFFVGRNMGITPGFANIDLRLTRSVAINERVKVQAYFEIFNLFNRVNISEVDRTFTRDSQNRFNLPPQDSGRFIAPPDRFRNAFSPRQCQYGFRLSF